MRRGTTLAAAVAATVLAGCGGSEGPESAPAACLEGSDAYLSALSAAPEPALLPDGTPIGACLVAGQGGGELGTVGTAMVGAAGELSSAARRDPRGPAALRLGYLVGAVERAAERTGGIHRDLVLRLEAAARFDQGGEQAVAFERAFDRGVAAGRAAG